MRRGRGKVSIDQLKRMQEAQRKAEEEEKQRKILEEQELQRLLQEKEKETKVEVKEVKISEKQQQAHERSQLKLKQMLESGSVRVQAFSEPRQKVEKILKPKVQEEQIKDSWEDSSEEEEIKVEVPKLRSPICCILGHVDTGKTKLLDKIRKTKVQDNEAGGITQQIGATYFPADAIQQKTKVVCDFEINVPGLLIIDTPGHESFSNLRSRGSSLCNIAILVVDIMHGLENQTRESIELLKLSKTPFIVALNKVDKLYDWNPTPNNSIQRSFQQQKPFVVDEFHKRFESIKLQFAEINLNVELYYENKNTKKFVSVVPTSAISGEGIPDMLYHLVDLTQQRMTQKIQFLGELEASVLEVKVVEGLGTTIDVILSDGTLNEGDKIVVCGMEGPIVTQIRALLTPQPMKELRIKSHYIHHKQIRAAMGVKISAPNLDKAVAGSKLYVCNDNEEELRIEVMKPLTSLLKDAEKSDRGVWVQASTLGSLEALCCFLKKMEIPISGLNIGPVHKKDVIKASMMLEHAKEYAVMLCFDVKIEKEARELADDSGLKIFTADIIYHLFDEFTKHHQQHLDQLREMAMQLAVFPCTLSIQKVFNKTKPLVLGVEILEGSLRTQTPLCVVQDSQVVSLGVVTSIEVNKKQQDLVKKGQIAFAIKIEDSQKIYGRHFDESNVLYSHLSRPSIEALKKHFRQELSQDDWKLVKNIRDVLRIQ